MPSTKWVLLIKRLWFLVNVNAYSIANSNFFLLYLGASIFSALLVAICTIELAFTIFASDRSLTDERKLTAISFFVKTDKVALGTTVKLKYLEDGEVDEMDQTVEVQLENGETEVIRQWDLWDAIQINQ